jgi:tetratricopeptide (TPR) repeat protein
MGVYAKDDERRAVPRWHWLQSGAARQEQGQGAAAPSGEPMARELRTLLDQSLLDWADRRSDVIAGEICAAAILSGEVEKARLAAEALLASSPMGSGGYSVACEILGRPGDKLEGAANVGDGIHVAISRLRLLLRSGAYDPLRWADLSRAYTIIGKTDAAMRAMITAQSLGRGSRALARAASRFWVHASDPERAHDVLMQSQRVMVDPWILSAEIAVANILERPSTHSRVAQKLLKSGKHSDRDVSELRVALGSQEVWFGNRKIGRKLLQQALIDPTENAIAQVAWFVRRDDVVPAPDSPSLGSAEADAWATRQRKEWSECLAACDQWWRIEPFSSRPSELASYMASTVVGDADKCVEYAKRGLRANPGSSVLWNNLAVGLAEGGLVDEAVNCLRRAAANDAVGDFSITLEATRGLIAYRSGRSEEGRRHYDNAIAKTRKNSDLSRMAALHLLREELRCGRAPAELIDIAKAATKVDDVVVAEMAKRVLQNVEEQSQSGTS